MKKKAKFLTIMFATFLVGASSSVALLTTNLNNQLNDTNNASNFNLATYANGATDISCFETDLKNYSAYDLVNQDQKTIDLLLDNLIQFNDGKFIKNPLLNTNMNKAEFFNRFFISFEITQDETKMGTEATIKINYRNDTNKVTSKTAKLKDLKPKVIFDLNLVNNQYDMKLQPKLAYDSAYEFAANFEQKITSDLIQFLNTSEPIFPLVKTNIQKNELSKFKPIFRIGSIDNIKGTIINNSISLLVPDLNLGQPTWSLTEDEFKLVTYNFDLINFAPNPIFVDFLPNGTFDVSKNNKLKNLTANDFNEEVFLQNLIQYNSTFLNKNFLVAINYDIDTFLNALSNFEITNVDPTNGQLDLSFTLEINGIFTHHQYQIQGFKKIISIENTKTSINKKDYEVLNDESLVKAFKEEDHLAIINFIKEKINFFFSNEDEAIFKVNSQNFAQLFLKDVKISFFKTLGQIKLNFILDLNAASDYVLYLNDQLLRFDQLELLIGGFQTKKVVLEIKKTKINDLNAYKNLNNFVDNFVDFIDETNYQDQNKAISNYSAIRTNLTRAEFNHIVNISFDRSDDYKIALVNIDYELNNQTHNAKIAINSIDKEIKYDISSQPFDVSKYPEFKNKSVDDFSKEDVLDLIGFNDKTNEYQILTVDASRALFENVLLKNINIIKHFDKVDVELDLMISPSQSVKKTIQVINLNWRLNEITIWTLVAFAALVGAIGISVVIAFMRRSYMKRKVMKVNNWNQFDEGGK